MTIEQYVTASTLPVDADARKRIIAACDACASIGGVLTAPREGELSESKAAVFDAVLALARELDACLPESAVLVVAPMVGRLRQEAVRAACGVLPNPTAAAEVAAQVYRIRAAAIDGVALDKA